MISKPELASSIPVARLLTDSGIVLRPYSDCVIYDALKALDTETAPSSDNLVELIHKFSIPRSVKGSDEDGDSVTIPSQHDSAKKRIVDSLAAGVNTVMNNALTTVIPAIKTIRDCIDENTKVENGVDALHPNLVVVNYDTIWSSVIVDGIATKYASYAGALPITSSAVPDNETLAKYLTTAHAELKQFVDHETVEWPELPRAIYSAFISHTLSNIDSKYHYLAKAITEIPRDVDGPVGYRININNFNPVEQQPLFGALIVAFVMLTNMVASPPAAMVMADGQSLAVQKLTSALNHVGNVISNVYRQRAYANKVGSLIINMPNVAGVNRGEAPVGDLIINGDIYKSYLSSGGTVEAILGNVYTSRSTSARTILDGKDKYEKAFEELKRTYAVVVSNNIHLKLSEIVTHSIFKYVDGMTPEQLASGNQSEFGSNLSGRTKDSIKRQVGQRLVDFTITNNPATLDKIVSSIVNDVIYASLRCRRLIEMMNNHPDQTKRPNVIASEVFIDLLIDDIMNETRVSQ